MELFLVLALAAVICITIFYIICIIIRLWTGCSLEEAIKKLRDFINGKPQTSFTNDVGFVNEIWENVRNIIGEKRFEKLCRLSRTAIAIPLIAFGEISRLPYIAITINFIDEAEKRVLETVILNVVSIHLRIYGYSRLMIAEWKTRYDLNMPYLEIRYARTEEEERVLLAILDSHQQKLATSENEVVDDIDGEDLNG